MSISDILIDRRELKRLREENKDLRQRERKLTDLLLERDFLFVDRFMTSVVKTYATGDAAKHNAEIANQTDAGEKAALADYLTARKTELYEDAKGDPEMTGERVDAYYREHEAEYIDEFNATNSFLNL